MTLPYVPPAAPGGNRPGDGPLRTGGVSVAQIPADKRENYLPSKESKAVEGMKPALGTVRDLMEGCQHVRSLGTKYLPQASRERADDYQVRRKRAVFHEFFGDTVEGLTGMVFRKDPVLGDDVPEIVKGDDEAGTSGHWENIDNAGTHGAVFAREVFQDALVAGHAAILVEFPKTGGRQSAADEKTAIRPYWVHIRKDHIVSWRTTVENGVTVLAQVVLKECTMVPDGPFGEREQTRYRVLFRDEVGLVGFRLLEVTEGKQVLEVDAGLYANQTEIPLVEVRTSGRKSMFESRPPLLGLAELNLAHYRQWSDHDVAIHMTCTPVAVRKGFVRQFDAQGNEIAVGPNDGVDLPSDGDFQWVSHDGQSLAHVLEAQRELVSQIASLGMSMLASQKRAAETATAKRIDKSATDSALAVSARGLQDALERALEFHAKYLRLESGGSIEVNRDFEALALDPQAITALSNLVAQGQLTIETLWKMLAQGNVLPDDFDADDEKAAVEAEAELKRQNALELAQAAPASPFGGKPDQQEAA